MGALERFLLRLGRLAAVQPLLQEVRISPLSVSARRVAAGKVCVTLRDPLATAGPSRPAVAAVAECP